MTKDHRRVLRLRFDERRMQLLESIAAENDVTADQLAGLWIRERLDATRPTDAGTLAVVAAELADIRDSIGRLAGARGRAAGFSGCATSGGRGGEGGRRGTLHREIMAVLSEQGQPMTASEIAAAIRIRGEYRAPRSGNPITGAAVSRRIANPYYRSLFERLGQRVSLAPRNER